MKYYFWSFASMCVYKKVWSLWHTRRRIFSWDFVPIPNKKGKCEQINEWDVMFGIRQLMLYLKQHINKVWNTKRHIPNSYFTNIYILCVYTIEINLKLHRRSLKILISASLKRNPIHSKSMWNTSEISYLRCCTIMFR